MNDFLFALVLMFFIGVISIACMLAALTLMLKNTDKRSRIKTVFMIILPVISIGCGAYSVFGLFGTGAAIVFSVILFIIALLVWLSLIINRK